MAAEKRGLFHAFRMSRKLALLSGGFLLVLGVSGTAALVLAPAHLIPGYSEPTSGSCKTLYQSDFNRGGEKRLIAVISTDDAKPADRIRTGMRIARHLAEMSQPDLITVQVVDHQGPTGRAEIRGPAIGAEIVHAPNPSKTVATSKPWEARYVDALPTGGGFYFGPRVDMRLAELETIDHEILLAEGCDGDVIDEDAKTAAHKETGSKAGHDAPAEPSGH
jgi:hypothetical protein